MSALFCYPRHTCHRVSYRLTLAPVEFRLNLHTLAWEKSQTPRVVFRGAYLALPLSTSPKEKSPMPPSRRRPQRTPGQVAAYELGRRLYHDRPQETHTLRREVHQLPDGTVVLVEEETITTERRY